MPYREIWVNPKKFMTYRGIVVYHAYKDNKENEMLTWSFQIDNTPGRHRRGGPFEKEFDVRDLPKYKTLSEEREESRETVHREVIRMAIDSGSLWRLLKMKDPRT